MRVGISLSRGEASSHACSRTFARYMPSASGRDRSTCAVVMPAAPEEAFQAQ